MIFFADERRFSDPLLSLITMLVWMLGELEYADILYPVTQNNTQTKSKECKLINGTEVCEKTYNGEIEEIDDYLQFAGLDKLSNIKLT